MHGLRKAIELQGKRLAKQAEERDGLIVLTLINSLKDMKLDPDGKVGQYVIKNMRPIYPNGEATIDETYGTVAVFDFLTLVGEIETT